MADVGIIVNKLNKLIREYIKEKNYNINIERYLLHIENIANKNQNKKSEELHNFVKNHPKYKKDSKIDQNISNSVIEYIVSKLFT